MRVWIAGMDGYLGWSLAVYLTAHGFTVAGADKLLRREWVAEVGSVSAIPIAGYEDRIQALRDCFGKQVDFRVGDLTDYDFVRTCLQAFQPDAIVHLAQMPSAPYSMIDPTHSVWTQQNNITTNLNILWAMRDVCPNSHLAKLGTMGEYGQPNLDIPEGYFEVEYRGRRDRLPFPRQAGSFYHLSKVHDSHNTEFACKIWGLAATDIMQGVVFGTQIEAMQDDARLQTRFDFDECFGTALNRFCCQAVISHPLTIYGKGGQTRGYLPLQDSMQCLRIILENPPTAGEYRVFNQFEASYSVAELAQIVVDASYELGIDATIARYENPRIEKAKHYYNPDRHHLTQLGYQPTSAIKAEVLQMLNDLMPHKERIADFRHKVVPEIQWRGARSRSNQLS